MSKFERVRHIKYFANALRRLPAQYSSADASRLTLVHFCVQALDVLGCLPDYPSSDGGSADICGLVEEEILIPRDAIVEWIYGLRSFPTSTTTATLIVDDDDDDDDGGGGGSVDDDDGGGGGDVDDEEGLGAPASSGRRRLRRSGGIDDDGGGVVGFRGGTYLGPILPPPPPPPSAPAPPDDDVVRRHPYDHSHLAMTYVALCTLLALGDDLSRVDRIGMLRTLKSLQREDGSFSSVRSSEEDDDDDSDLRFLYAAAAIRYLLLAKDDDDGPTTSGGGEDEDDIDVESAVSYVLSCRSYDGALGLTPGREGHGGSTFCGIAALRLLDRALGDVTTTGSEGWGEDLIRWCASRQLRLPTEKATTRRGENEDCDENDGRGGAAGMQGRPNKPEDTCYSYWIGGTMHLLGMSHLLDGDSLREYVLSCQTMFGGFGKVSGAMPDLLHSFYSLAWLSLSNERGVCCDDDRGSDDGRGDDDGGGRHNRDYQDEVEGSIGRLSELDCAMGMCSKRVRRAIRTNGERGKIERHSRDVLGHIP